MHMYIATGYKTRVQISTIFINVNKERSLSNTEDIVNIVIKGHVLCKCKQIAFALQFKKLHGILK